MLAGTLIPRASSTVPNDGITKYPLSHSAIPCSSFSISASLSFLVMSAD